MISDTYINLFNMLGTWLSGVGSLFVGVVAIILSRNPPKLKPILDVTSSYGFIIDDFNKQNALLFRLTNKSQYKIKIYSFSVRFYKEKFDAFMCPNHQLPIIIESGLMESIQVNWETFGNSLKESIFFEKMNMNNKNYIKKMKVLTHTSLGTISSKPASNLIQALEELSKGQGKIIKK